MSKFTPGPWRVQDRAGQGYGKQFDVMTPKGFAFKGDQLKPDGTSISEARANAELAAIAPEMYAELKRLADALDIAFEGGFSCPGVATTNAARALLARING